MRKSNESPPGVESDGLVLPDWSGMDDSAARVSPDAAFQLCEQYPVWFADAAAKWHAQRPEKCHVEFVL